MCAVVLAGCSSTSGTPRQQVQQWANQFGYDSLNAQIQDDLSFINKAVSQHRLSALQTNCNGFPGDVEPLYESLPTPNTALTNELGNASESWFNAAADCVAAKSFSSRDYRQYAKAMSSAARQYAVAKKRLATFGVR